MENITISKSKKNIKDIKDLDQLTISFQHSDYPLSLETTEELEERYFGEIYLDSSFSGNNKVLIGKVDFIYINLCKYINNKINIGLDDLMWGIDSDVYLIYQTLYDYNTVSFSDKIEKELGYDIFNSNFVVLSNLEILPQYRNYNIGEMVLKFATDFFNEKAGFIVLKSFPKQFELFENSDPWRTEMEYKNMCKKFQGSPKTAQKSLDKFYSKHMTKLKSYKGEGSIFYSILS